MKVYINSLSSEIYFIFKDCVLLQLAKNLSYLLFSVKQTNVSMK